MAHRWRSALALLALAALVAGCAGSSSRAGSSSGAVDAAQTPTPTLSPTLPPVIITLPAPISASAAYMFDPITGQTLYAFHANDEMAMASTTKIMTALVAIMAGNLDQTVTVTPAINELAGDQASVVCCPTLQIGQHYTLRDLLYGLLLPSGDDAAILIADAVAGSEHAFVARMNATALLLGLFHTHYANVTGLDAAGHFTSPSDLAHLAADALDDPLFQRIVGTAFYTIPANATHPAIQLANTNLLLTGFGGPALGVDGVKTGFTGNAGYCLVADARHAGHEAIVVVLGEPTEFARFTDDAALLQWYFARVASGG